MFLLKLISSDYCWRHFIDFCRLETDLLVLVGSLRWHSLLWRPTLHLDSKLHQCESGRNGRRRMDRISRFGSDAGESGQRGQRNEHSGYGCFDCLSTLRCRSRRRFCSISVRHSSRWIPFDHPAGDETVEWREKTRKRNEIHRFSRIFDQR